MSDVAGWIITGLVALFGWGFRVEMKIREHDAAIQRQEDALMKHIEDVKADLRYIRDRVDRMVADRHA